MRKTYAKSLQKIIVVLLPYDTETYLNLSIDLEFSLKISEVLPGLVNITAVAQLLPREQLGA